MDSSQHTYMCICSHNDIAEILLKLALNTNRSIMYICLHVYLMMYCKYIVLYYWEFFPLLWPFHYYQLIECLHWPTYFVYKYDNITWRTIHTGVSVFCIFLSTRQNITKKRFGTKQLFPLLKYMIKQTIHNMSFFISPFISPHPYIIPRAYWADKVYDMKYAM